MLTKRPAPETQRPTNISGGGTLHRRAEQARWPARQFPHRADARESTTLATFHLSHQTHLNQAHFPAGQTSGRLVGDPHEDQRLRQSRYPVSIWPSTTIVSRCGKHHLL